MSLPIFVALVVISCLFSFFTFVYCCEHLPNTTIWHSLGFVPIIVMVAWMILLSIGPVEYTKPKTVLSHKIENIDIAIINGEAVNLNETFSRSFNDGDQVKIHKKKSWYYLGVFYNSDYPYKLVEGE